MHTGFAWAALGWAIGAASIGVADDGLLRLQVLDADTQRPLACRVYLQSEAGDSFYMMPETDDGTCIRYDKQNRRNQNSIERHTTVSAHPCLAHLPAGNYRLTVECGKSYLSTTRQVAVSDKPLALTILLKRFCDPGSRHWYSGDTHLHRTVDELRNVVLAEDLNVALPLTQWVTVADTPPAAGNRNQQDSGDTLIEVDGQHVIWPLNTEYEIFTVGGKRHTLGALFVLGHKRPLQIGVPPWRPVVESTLEADPNVLFDMDKLDWPFAMVLPTIVPGALYELSNNHVWRTEFAFRNWNSPAPPFLQPPFGGLAGGHRQWIDYSLGMYYTLLNCGFRMPPSAGTANGVHPVPAGFGRVYVHLPDGFGFASWMAGLKAGRSFVTTGPMLYATADDHDPGYIFQRTHESEPTPISLRAELISEAKLSYGELLVNGRPEKLLRPQNRVQETGAYVSQIECQVTPNRSGWFALRFWEPRPDGQSRFVHSAPWYVEVDQRPVQISREEKAYLVDRIQREIDRSNEVVPPAALEEYGRALEFYRDLPVYDDTPEVQAEARHTEGEELARWLDNMILDHRFSAGEVRRATGFSWEEAEQAIADRAGKQRPQDGEPQVRLLPYPGGRHPRRGFWDGALRPQRETKVSIFPPWSDAGYVAVDVPEAVFSNLGLTYLAHTHIPTIWDAQDVELEPLEWTESAEGLSLKRELPNGIALESRVTRQPAGARMQLALTNGTQERLTGLRVQVCVMLKGAQGFNKQEKLEQVEDEPFIAVRAEDSKRWIVSAWQPCHRVWTNPPVPCFHSDPIFPDCPPGETVHTRGGIWFYEGDDVHQEIRRLRKQWDAQDEVR